MKSKLIPILLGCAIASLAHADFNPVALTPGSFTGDVIIEKSAGKLLNDYVTATMDGGTNNNGSTFTERGYFAQAWVGLPTAGSTFNSITDGANHQFKMPPSYTTNNAVLMTTNQGALYTNGNLTITTPVALTSLSLLASAGGQHTVNYTIRYVGGGIQAGTLAINDWTQGTAIAWYAQGRVNLDDGTLASLAYTNGTNRRLQYYDIALTDNVNAVTNIQFSAVDGGRAFLFGLSGSTGGGFTPLDVTGFNRDVVIEASAPAAGFIKGASVTIDSDTLNNGNGLYEQGFNRAAPTTGLPTNGTSFTVVPRTWTMPASYTANNAFFLANDSRYTTATITFTTPAVYTNISFLTCAGNGPTVFSVTVHHSGGGADEVFSVSALDWFNGATAEFVANGRYQKEGLAFNNVNGGAVKLYHNDIAITGLNNVTSIDVARTSGGRVAILALTGATVGSGGAFSPIAVTGYNSDAIVERALSYPTGGGPNSVYTNTTISMDTGTNNNNNTFYEVGYYKGQPSSGFPAAGSTINSLALPDHHYQMPASYTNNDCVYLDATHPTANITIASPATYSAFSFLSADGNGIATNQAIMQYADGTSETNQFNALDWFNNTPVAYYANGRIDMNRGTINNDPGRNGNITNGNPRLYEAQFALGNTGSPVTNILLRFLNPTNSGTRSYVFAVSATAGAVPPIIASVSRSTAAAIYEGTNVTFNAVISGGTAPITYQWQKGTNGVYVNLVNGGNIAGVTTTNLVITGATTSNVGDYRLVASNITGPVASGILTISRVVSPLNDVTSPGDTITITTGTAGGGAEAVTSAVDNTIQKFLGVSTTPFSGSGFIVKPALGNTIVSVLRIYTANDAEGRDPADYVLEGSLDGIGFTAISSGSLALPSGRNGTATDVPNPLVHNLQEVKFVNTAGYTYYRVSFNNVKDNSQNLMQVGEVDLLGILNPTPPPSFAANVADVSANEGSTATFISSAVGPAPLTYQWYDVTAGDPGTAILNKTNANLVLPGVTAGQNGNRYRVVATNPYGSTTNPAPALPGAQLTVTTGPVSIVQDLPAELLFYAGRIATLSVIVSGSTPAYQWQSNGVNLVNGGRISGAQSNILTISNIQFSDAASYQVITSNQISGPLASSASQVYVTATPTFHTNGIGWQVINGGTSLPSIGSDTFSMTFNGNERAAAWFTTPMNINAFKASFLYQDVSVGGADGFGFVMQNSASGTNALGGGGGFMAYSGITNSAAVLFNIFNQSSVAFGSNGVIGGYGSTLPVNLPSGNPIMVNLNYAGSTLTVTLSNTVTADVFTTNMVVGSLASIVGTNVAYIGITAATGGVSSQQQVSNFQYIPVPSLAAQSAGGLANLTWPASIGGYSVQSGSNLTAPVWSTVNALINQVNGNNQVTVSPTNSAAFYRLMVVPTP